MSSNGKGGEVSVSFEKTGKNQWRGVLEQGERRFVRLFYEFDEFVMVNEVLKEGGEVVAVTQDRRDNVLVPEGYGPMGYAEEMHKEDPEGQMSAEWDLTVELFEAMRDNVGRNQGRGGE